MRRGNRAKTGRNEQAMMDAPAGPVLRDIRLDRRAGRPLYRQVAARIEASIRDGTLPPGTRLPSSRSLASQLAVARATIEQAYQMLAGDGYLEARAAAGTIVARRLDAGRLSAAKQGAAKRQVILPGAMTVGTFVFQMGVPAFDAFPRKLWTRLTAGAARSLSPAQMTYQDPTGHEPLRREIVRYLAIARGIACSIDQVFITAGFLGALGLITRTLLKPGDPVWIEDPAYFFSREALALAGATLVPVPIDGDGLDVSAGLERAAEAKFALVTPTNQFPLGVSLSASRRVALLSWANATGAWIIEDDYDSEFRYRGPPMPALKSIDANGRVLYAGTFSKVLFPALRLGYLVVPEPEIERFARSMALLLPHQSLLDQMSVAEFMAQGHFARHIARMRGLYGERRAALLRALEALPGAYSPVEVQAGGMHVLARLEAGRDDVAAAARARSIGLAPEALSPFAMECACGPGLLLSFTNLPVEAADREVRKLQRILNG
jgi:GntR family transcriptional regulator/MocR family aminotransferase